MIKKYSIKVADHLTSISLEEDFWIELKAHAKKEGKSLSQIITEIDAKQEDMNASNLSSAIRLYILRTLKQK